MHRCPRSALAIVVCLLLGLSCARPLPESLAPKNLGPSSTIAGDRDVIGYRTLTRADFKGTACPEAFGDACERLGAATCLEITMGRQLRVKSVGTRDAAGVLRYYATPVDFVFRAEMHRHCSWWKPSMETRATAYTQQHEQIHFALHEIEARQQNARIAEWTAATQATAATREAAAEALRARFQTRFDEMLERLMARHRSFDKATSANYSPERQAEWWARVQAELSATAHLRSQARAAP